MALTVRQLISELEKYDLDSEVIISDLAHSEIKHIEIVCSSEIDDEEVVEIVGG